MLLFIKYILQLTIETGDSNTSHVIVYQNVGWTGWSKNGFKYISCYCLSLYLLQIQNPTDTIQIHLMLLFISNVLLSPLLAADSNTSHVIVYQVTQI